MAGAALAAGLLLTGCPAQDDGEDDGAGIEQEDQQEQGDNEQDNNDQGDDEQEENELEQPENEQEQGDDG